LEGGQNAMFNLSLLGRLLLSGAVAALLAVAVYAVLE
jgi:hypothetical protein